MDIADTKLIKELREKTGCGYVDCKNALENHGNDMEKAIENLRKKGLANAVNKAGRATRAGRVESYIHGEGKIGVLLEVNCESDFVAHTSEFQNFFRNVALHIAAASPRFLNAESVVEADLAKEREIFSHQAEQAGKTGSVLEKIVEGNIKKFYEENCLLSQRYVREPDKNIESLLNEAIAQLGENIAIRRFVRF